MSTRARVIAVGVVVGVLLSGCGGGTSGDSDQLAPSAQASAPPTTPAPSPPARQPTVADQLTGFFDAVDRVDAQLRSVADRVNGEVGEDGAGISAATVAAVEAVEPAQVVREIPGGLPPEVLRRVMLVYSDLVTRRLAFRGVEHSGPAPDASLFAWVLECLASGGKAADRFAADVADARAVAAATPAVPSTAPDSQAVAEVAVRAEAISGGLGACGSCFGTPQTALDPLVWEGSGAEQRGTVNGMPFSASYRVGTGWVVTVEAC